MVEDTNYYKLENAIKSINLIEMDNNEENKEEKIKKQFNLEAKTKINIEKEYGSLSYEGHKFEEYFWMLKIILIVLKFFIVEFLIKKNFWDLNFIVMIK